MSQSNSFADDVERFISQVMVELADVSYRGAIACQNHMKRHAPWTNRTGHARQRLTATSALNLEEKAFIITLAHGVDYGVYLELAHEKRFAIILPTIRVLAPQITQEFRGVIDRVRGE